MDLVSADAATYFETGIGRSQNSLAIGSLLVESRGEFPVDKSADDKAIPRRGDMRPFVDGNGSFRRLSPRPAGVDRLNGALEGSLSGRITVSHGNLIAIFLIQDDIFIPVVIGGEIGRRI